MFLPQKKKWLCNAMEVVVCYSDNHFAIYICIPYMYTMLYVNYISIKQGGVLNTTIDTDGTRMIK